MAQLAREGSTWPGGDLLVGENGSGKSTLVEAVAMAYGLSPEGARRGAPARHPADRVAAGRALRIVRAGSAASRWGFFLRAETMHGWYTYLEQTRPGQARPGFHEMSHGESFLAVLGTRFDSPGFYCLDEPEAALSFSSTLGLITVLQRVEAGRAGALRDPLPRPRGDAGRPDPRGRRWGLRATRGTTSTSGMARSSEPSATCATSSTTSGTGQVAAEDR